MEEIVARPLGTGKVLGLCHGGELSLGFPALGCFVFLSSDVHGRGMRYTLTCFASFPAFRLLRACGFYMTSLLMEKHNVNR